MNLGTDKDAPDTDKDGLLDGDEVSRATDPLNPDTDGDGVIDGAEVNDGAGNGNPLCVESYRIALLDGNVTAADACITLNASVILPVDSGLRGNPLAVLPGQETFSIETTVTPDPVDSAKVGTPDANGHPLVLDTVALGVYETGHQAVVFSRGNGGQLDWHILAETTPSELDGSMLLNLFHKLYSLDSYAQAPTLMATNLLTLQMSAEVVGSMKFYIGYRIDNEIVMNLATPQQLTLANTLTFDPASGAIKPARAYIDGVINSAVSSAQHLSAQVGSLGDLSIYANIYPEPGHSNETADLLLKVSYFTPADDLQALSDLYTTVPTFDVHTSALTLGHARDKQVAPIFDSPLELTDPGRYSAHVAYQLKDGTIVYSVDSMSITITE